MYRFRYWYFISSVVIRGTNQTQENYAPSELPSGSGCEVNVTFTPRSKSAKNRRGDDETNGFFSPTVTITLSGAGRFPFA